MKIKFLIFSLLLVVMTVSFGCIESDKTPVNNLTTSMPETEIAIPVPSPSITEQKLPPYDETEPLKINDTFVTWSMGYQSNTSYEHPYFRVITNYTKWISFLNEQDYFSECPKCPGLEGTLFPGWEVKPKTIEPDDFNNYFIIAAMMGRRGYSYPKIEIINISRINNSVNVTVGMYIPRAGDLVTTGAYHIVIVKREMLPEGNSTFNFIDTEGKLLGRVEIKPVGL